MCYNRMSFFNYIKPKCFSTQVNVLSTVLSTVLSIQKKELLLISSMRFTLSSYKVIFTVCLAFLYQSLNLSTEKSLMIWSITIFINKIRWVFYEKNNSRWFRKSECLSNCKMTIAQNFLIF